MSWFSVTGKLESPDTTLAQGTTSPKTFLEHSRTAASGVYPTELKEQTPTALPRGQGEAGVLETLVAALRSELHGTSAAATKLTSPLPASALADCTRASLRTSQRQGQPASTRVSRQAQDSTNGCMPAAGTHRARSSLTCLLLKRQLKIHNHFSRERY